MPTLTKDQKDCSKWSTGCSFIPYFPAGLTAFQSKCYSMHSCRTRDLKEVWNTVDGNCETWRPVGTHWWNRGFSVLFPKQPMLWFSPLRKKKLSRKKTISLYCFLSKLFLSEVRGRTSKPGVFSSWAFSNHVINRQHTSHCSSEFSFCFLLHLKRNGKRHGSFRKGF